MISILWGLLYPVFVRLRVCSFGSIIVLNLTMFLWKGVLKADIIWNLLEPAALT